MYIANMPTAEKTPRAFEYLQLKSRYFMKPVYVILMFICPSIASISL